MKKFAEDEPVLFLAGWFLAPPLMGVWLFVDILRGIYCWMFPGAKKPDPDKEMAERDKEVERAIAKIKDPMEQSIARREWEARKRERLKELMDRR